MSRAAILFFVGILAVFLGYMTLAATLAALAKALFLLGSAARCQHATPGVVERL